LTIFEFEAHARRDGLGLVDRIGFRGLSQVDQFLVVAEVAREELRVAVDPETLDHQALEMAQQKVRQIERPELRLGERREHRSGREELVAMGARYALDALLLQHRVEQPAGSAVGVGDENRTIVTPRGLNQCAHRRRYALGAVVQVGGQASHVHVVPAVCAAQRRNFMGQRAAGDDQHALTLLRRVAHRTQ